MRLKHHLSKAALAQIFTHSRVAFMYIQLIFFICILDVLIHVLSLFFQGFEDALSSLIKDVKNIECEHNRMEDMFNKYVVSL